MAVLVVGAVAGSSSTSDERDYPDDEQAFIEAVQAGQSVAEGGNEIAVSKARDLRGKKICALLDKDMSVSAWEGTVESIETELGGDRGVLSVEIADGVAVQTWNNALSDSGDDTLIETDDPMWDVLASMGEGDEVVFSGEFLSQNGEDCINEASLMEVNSMRHPDYVFRFTKVRKK